MIDPARLRRTCFDLVSVVSPTGDTLEVAELYARQLTEAGMDVDINRDFPQTPTIVATLAGNRPGPRIVLNGHLDTVPIAHEAPRLADGGATIYGRGSADMKGAMACAGEVARILKAGGADFPGEVVVVAIGLHEAPLGRGEDLIHLLRERGFKADAAIVLECGRHNLPLAHMGSATFEITISRPGIPTHELQTEPGMPHPLLAAGRIIAAIGARAEELKATDHELVGYETYFIGEVHGGDFYNRFPTTCRLVGTRRWAPGERFDAVEEEFEGLLAELARETGCRIDLDLRIVRDSYQLDRGHPLVTALRSAYEEVAGAELPIIGMKTVADAAIWTNDGGIPAVYHGPVGEGAHADVEYMPVAEMEKATAVYLATLRNLWAAS